MNGIIYYTKIRDEYNGKNMEHMIGEKLLEIGLEREFGRKLAFEPRSKGGTWETVFYPASKNSL